MARIASTAVFTSSRMSFDRTLLCRYSEISANSEWADHITSSYSLAFRFCLNDFYIRDFEFEYLLGRSISGFEKLGEIWSDWIRVKNHRLGTESIHICFCFSSPIFDECDESCSVIENVARFNAMVYRLPEESVATDPALIVLGTDLQNVFLKRRNALGLSRYAYTSLYGLKRMPDIKDCDAGLRTNLYRLLYMHALGADSVSANERLGEPWRCTRFYELYRQPGAILSVSTPYPVVAYKANLEWFQPSPPHTWRSGTDDFVGAKYEEYDLLPEYPPMRYLALPCLEYAANFEETLRESQESTFESATILDDQSAFPKRQFLMLLNIGAIPFRYVFHVIKNHRGKFLKMHLLAASLEGIRLPIARPFVSAMFDNTHQERTAIAVTTWATRRMAVLATILAVIALLATFTFKYFDAGEKSSTTDSSSGFQD